MTVVSIPELFRALGGGEAAWGAILGTVEAGWIEFKAEPYRLDDVRGKLELAKDVSAMANVEAGVIVIGVKTERESHQNRDVALKIRKVPIEHLKVDQLKDMISRYTYPPLKGIECDVHLDAESEKGLLTLFVPRQDESEKYFIVTEVVTDDGVNKGNMVGVFRREGDRADHLPAQYIHELIRAGKRARGIEESSGLPLGALEAIALQVAGSDRPGPAVAGAATAEEQAKMDIEAAELGEETLLVVQAWHGRGFDITGEIHKRGPDGFRTAFEQPPQLRPNGFNIDFYGDTEVLPGGGVRTIRAGIAALSVLPNGVCTLVVGSYYLGWATEKRFGKDSEAINPLVITEFTAEFCRFVATQVSRRSRQDAVPTYRIALRNLDKNGAKKLAPGFGHEPRLAGPLKRPPDDLTMQSKPILEQDPGTASFRLLQEIYANYGVSPDQIPCADVEAGRIDFSLLEAV